MRSAHSPRRRDGGGGGTGLRLSAAAAETLLVSVLQAGVQSRGNNYTAVPSSDEGRTDLQLG